MDVFVMLNVFSIFISQVGDASTINQVKIIYNLDNEPLCLGTPISNDTIVTSARCVYYPTWDGQLPLSMITIETEYSREYVNFILIHLEYNSQSATNNLAIIKITKPCLHSIPLTNQKTLSACQVPIMENNIIVWKHVKVHICGLLKDNICIDDEFVKNKFVEKISNGSGLICNEKLIGVRNFELSSTAYTPIEKYLDWMSINSAPEIRQKFFIILSVLLINIII